MMIVGLRQNRARRGLSIVECVTSMVVLGLLAGAVLSTVSAASASRQVAADRVVGLMLVEELLSEIRAKGFHEPGNAGAALGPDAGEVSGSSRAAFDDMDDYHGLVESPPRAVDGTALAGLTATGTRAWGRLTTVVLSTRTDPTASGSLNVKTVTVVVKRGSKEVARGEYSRSGVWEAQERPGPVKVLVQDVTSILFK